MEVLSERVHHPRRAGAVGVAFSLLSLLAFALIAMTGPAASAATHSVTIANFAFSSPSMTISVGDTVTWTNTDDAPHTVTGSSGPVMLDSPTLNKGDSWSFTFTKAGTYKYFCAIHPNMMGAITVVDSSTTVPVGAPTTATSMAGMGSMGSPAAGGPASSCSNQNLLSAVIAPFVVHLEHAHLEESLSQQLHDLVNVNQYVLTHTVLVENMLNALFNLILALPNALQPLLTHIDHAHLEESPAQQVQDIANINQYLLTHTVLVENMLAPLTQSVTGTYGC